MTNENVIHNISNLLFYFYLKNTYSTLTATKKCLEDSSTGACRVELIHKKLKDK